MSVFQVFVKDFVGKTFNFILPLGAQTTVKALQAAVLDKTGVPVADQRLLYAGRTLSEGNVDFVIAEYGVMNMSTLHLVARLHGGR